MTKSRRQAILDIIEKHEINTQQELSRELELMGFSATQATISRDIRQLGLVKVSLEKNRYKYAKNAEAEKDMISGRFSVILSQAMKEADYAGNLVVIKTYTGMGSAAGAAVDSMTLPGVIGSLAGDDTLLVITRDPSAALNIYNEFKKLIKQSH